MHYSSKFFGFYKRENNTKNIFQIISISVLNPQDFSSGELQILYHMNDFKKQPQFHF